MANEPPVLPTSTLLVSVLIISLFALSLFTLAGETHEVTGGNGITLPPPPATAVIPVAEDVHGTTLTDPYRWLEDGKSPETRAWIDAQMSYTQGYLSQVKIRPQIVQR